MTKVCSKCGEEKDESEFEHWRRQCKTCRREIYKLYNNSFVGRERARKFCMTEKCKDTRRKYKQSEHGKEVNKKYARGHKRKAVCKKYKKKKWHDACYKLRSSVSGCVNRYLKIQGASKGGKTFLKYLPYSLKQLKEHIESQFEPWMNWENHGAYRNNEKTWQIDHIIPQSRLPYDSMKHENFQKCWALENLRPLETIENLSKGNKIV